MNVVGNGSASAELSESRRRYALFLLLIVSSLNFVDRYILAVLLEPIKNEFSLTDTQLGLLSGLAFALFYATLGLPLARFADRGNRRRLLAVALTLWSGMTALGAAAGGFVTLLLTRIGVGVGEAAATPASHSLIADYYPPERRGGAIGVISAGTTIGYVLAFMVGGLVAQHYGWRAALIAVGLPGLFVGALVWLTLPEPRDARPLAPVPKDERSAALADLKTLLSSPAYVHLLAAATLWMFVGYGAIQWIASYLVRVRGMELGEVGVIYGGLAAAAGLIGALLGGVLTNAFAKRSTAWLAYFPGIACAVSYPLFLPAFLAGDTTLALVFVSLGSVALALALPAMYASLHVVIPDRIRAFGIAFVLFVGNLIGLGLGPLAVGVVSDALQPQYGDAGLGIALSGVYALLVWAGLHFVLAGRLIAKTARNQAAA